MQNTPFEQAALAKLLEDRTVDRHVARMRRLYGRRRSVVMTALFDEFGHEAQILGDSSGLHLAVRLKGATINGESIARLRSCGVAVTSVEKHAILPGRWLDTILLGYGHLDEEHIRQGIAALAAVLKAEACLGQDKL